MSIQGCPRVTAWLSELNHGDISEGGKAALSCLRGANSAPGTTQEPPALTVSTQENIVIFGIREAHRDLVAAGPGQIKGVARLLAPDSRLAALASGAVARVHWRRGLISPP